MRRVLEQRLERAEAGHLVEDFGDEVVELLGVERQALDHDVLRDELLDVRAHLVLGQLLQRREVDLLDQPAVQPHLGVEQLVAAAADWPARRAGSARASAAPRPSCRLAPRRRRSSGAAARRACRGRGAAASAMRRVAVKRPTIGLPSPRQRELALGFGRRRRCAAGLGGCRRQISFLSSCRDLVAGLDLVERHAAVDRLAHQAVVVRDACRRSRSPSACSMSALAQARRRTGAARSG